jgi:hypothetical protein
MKQLPSRIGAASRWDLLVVAVCCVCLPGTALAWGADGHRTTGYIAQPLLSPVARTELLALMGEVDVPKWSTWMDEQRDRLKKELPGSNQWHYDDRPVCGGSVDKAEYCPNGDCASEQADRLMGVLADPDSPVEARRQAVLMLVHIIGDIHQPLHAGENHDQGGNQVRITLVGPLFPTNLHAVWDSDLVNMGLWSGAAAARQGETMVRGNAKALASRFAADFPGWRKGTLDVWMEESRALSRRWVYDPLPNFQCGLPTQAKGTGPMELPVAYLEGGRRLVPQQLARAGVRIAQVLNTTLEAAARRRQTSAATAPR